MMNLNMFGGGVPPPVVIPGGPGLRPKRRGGKGHTSMKPMFEKQKKEDEELLKIIENLISGL